MPGKQWSLLSLLLLILVLGLAGGVNYLVDPFSRREDHSLQLARREINRNKNVPLWSVFSVNRIPGNSRKSAEVVILGDSRATLLTQREGTSDFRTATVAGSPVFNLSLGGGSIQEALSFFESQQEQAEGFPSLKKVVFTLPFNRICEPGKVDRIAQSVEMADQPFLYYLNGYVLKTSLVTLTKHGKDPGAVKKKLTKSDGDKALQSWMRVYSSYDRNLARKREELLKIFVDQMNSRGVEVIFYQPPGGASGRELMKEIGMEGEYDRFLQVFGKLGRLENFADETEIDGREFSYRTGDPIHHDQGVKILEKILRR